MMMMMMIIINCFCGMVDWRKVLSLISSRDHCQRSSPSRISDTPQVGFETAQNLILGLVKWNCAIVFLVYHYFFDNIKFQYMFSLICTAHCTLLDCCFQFAFFYFQFLLPFHRCHYYWYLQSLFFIQNREILDNLN